MVVEFNSIMVIQIRSKQKQYPILSRPFLTVYCHFFINRIKLMIKKE